jgi:hypothetical protein
MGKARSTSWEMINSYKILVEKYMNRIYKDIKIKYWTGETEFKAGQISF